MSSRSLAYVYTEKQAAMTSTSDPRCNASPLRKIPSDHHEEFSPPVAADVSYVEEINHAAASRRTLTESGSEQHDATPRQW